MFFRVAPIPWTLFKAYVYELSKVFGEAAILLVLDWHIAGKALTASRSACLAATFKDWQAIYAEQFLAAGYSEQQASGLAIVFHALTEGGILLALTMKSGKPLEVIAEQIPFLLIKK